MATQYDGSNSFVNQTTKTIHSGQGAVLAITASHNQPSTQTITLYDAVNTSGTVLTKIHIAPEASPAHIQYPGSLPLRFTNGLTVEAGNCDVHILAIGR